ncbi:MAG: glycosyltransferase family 9 protein [Bacteroidota bacterium]
MKILIIALSGIGDALMFSPALRLLRDRYPDAEIDLLAMFRSVADLYRNNPDLTSVIFWDFLHESPIKSFGFVYSNLRRCHYDVSISVYPQNRREYNIISVLIHAHRRLAHRYRHLSRNGLDFLNTDLILEDVEIHNVEENVRLVKNLDISTPESLPPLQISLPDSDRDFAAQWLYQSGIPAGTPLIGFHSGSALLKNHIRRRWKPEKFAVLGKELTDNYGVQVLLFGGPEEYELNDRINSLMGGKGIVVRVDGILSSISIMEKCRGFITNDSGLMHIASAVALPVVAIFAYTNPKWVHPWKTKYRIVRHDLECSPCFYYSPRSASCKWDTDQFRCIEHIEVDEVLDAAKELFFS